jgi:hypothetical protein
MGNKAMVLLGAEGSVERGQGVPARMWKQRNDRQGVGEDCSGNSGQFSLRQRAIYGQNQTIIDQILPVIENPYCQGSHRRVDWREFS